MDEDGEGRESSGGNEGQESSGGAGSPTTTIDPATITDPALRAYVEKLAADTRAARREAGGYRTKLRDAEGKVAEFERARMTDQEKLAADLAAAQQERDAALALVRSRDLAEEVQQAAKGADAISPQAVWRQIKDDIVVDGKGKPTNLAALIKDLKAAEPYMFRRTDADAGAGNRKPAGGGNGALDMNAQLRAALRGQPL